MFACLFSEFGVAHISSSLKIVLDKLVDRDLCLEPRKEINVDKNTLPARGREERRLSKLTRAEMAPGPNEQGFSSGEGLG
eukprot:6177987-Pleurochrysis_carterae.AAC.2